MKLYTGKFLAALWLQGALIVITCLYSQIVLSETTVTLVGDPWPPYVEGTLGEDAHKGITVQIINAIFSGLEDVKARFPLIPWKRALREVEEGHQDGIGMLLKTPEREKYMAYSDPLLDGKNLVWSVEKDNGSYFEWNEMADFHKLKLGIIRGYSYGDAMDKEIELGNVSIIAAPTVDHLFAMLVNGRVDIVVANDAVGYAQQKKHRSQRIKPAQKMLNSETFYIGFSKKSPAVELLPRINQIIGQLRDRGEIERIIKGQ